MSSLAFAVLSCAEPAASPRAEPMPSASLEVPPLPPPKEPPAKTSVREVPALSSADDEEPPLPRDAAAAEQAFQEARQAMQAGDLVKARALFLKSYRYDPAGGSLLNLALCEERLGDRESAIKHYQAAYDNATRDGRTDRAALAKARLDALRTMP